MVPVFKIVFFLLLGCAYLKAGQVSRIYIKDIVYPPQHSTVQIICDVLNYENNIKIFKESTGNPPASTPINSCSDKCLFASRDGADFTVVGNTIKIDINKVNRTRDQKYWFCEDKWLFLQIYTVPTRVQLENPTSQDEDLVQNAVTLTCSTGCVYPVTSFTWFYTETGGSRQEWPNSGSVSYKAGVCTDSERIYTSTLSLTRFTTFPGNADKTVKFSCGITSFPGLAKPLYTNLSGNVRFAVRVTNVAVKDGASAPADPLIVVNGISKTLTCITSVSRPVATVVWYIGTEEKQRSSTSSSFTFIPQNNDHNKQIYCKAFNLQPEKDAVSSNKATLYIPVPVASVILKEDSSLPTEPIEVISGVSKTLTCTTSTSRPTATIAWYIGADMKQSSYSSTFTFTPGDGDHKKQIFCKANNTKAENEAVSSNKFTFYVKVYATRPTITGHTTENRVVFENDTVTLECISSITRPVALVTWKKGSDILQNEQNSVTNHDRDLASIKSTVNVTLNRNYNNKNITCETSIPGQENKANAQQGITVYWPPSTPIPTTNLPFLEGQRGKSIYCQATVYGNPTATALWSIEYGTPNNLDSRQLDLPILSSQQDGIPASCQLKNQFTETKSIQIQSPAIRIEVEYSPVVHILESNIEITTITRNEGQSISILCNANGNPVPTVRWIGRTPNDEYLRFDDLDRREHGTYTCKASAKSTNYPEHNFDTEKKLNLVVNYAPVVTVDLSNTDPEEDTSLLISCKATGRPNKYNYTSVFQTWGTVNIPNTHLPANGIIDIKNLKIEDSGTYTCLVNNGIADRNNKLDQTGNVTVLIKASPKVLLEDTKSAGEIGKSVNIIAPFYSHPDISQVEFRFQNGTKVKNSSKYGVYYKKNVVNDRFYGQTVELEGYIAVLQIVDEVETDFMNYTLILGNGIGSTNVTLNHISQSKPSVPKFFNYTGLVNSVPTFLLEGGFNGGQLQTFVIETAIAGSDKWVEQLRFSENDTNFLQKEKLIFIFNITGLGPNSYDVRARVGNGKGWIDDNAAPKISFTIPKEIKPTQTSSLGVIAGAVGSAVTVIIIAAVVMAVIIWKRRYRKRDESSAAINGRRQVDESDSSDDEVMTENLAYVSADEVSKKVKHTGADADSTYAQPHKAKKDAAFETGDLYSSVNKAKPEDQKNQKQKKQKEKAGKDLKTGKQRKNKNDDVYENASELTPVKTKKASEGRKEAYDENPYENPEESKPTQKKNVNKDGLIYADLTFNEQPKGQKKLVIHGLDSMTEYVEVDFTKKAEPLPDSDEETADKK